MVTDTTTTNTSATPHSRAFTAYLLMSAVLCGGLIMVVEVMGSRVVGPFFGVSLFVWTSLITVALLALAGGYALGGLLSDRLQKPAYLFGIILAAGVLTLLVPLIKGPVLQASMPLGLRVGALVSTTVLFGPALLLLGCVAPYLVKLVAQGLQNIGRVVGGLYALSTVGSTLGTVLTGFFLIAYLGVDQIFFLTGGLMVLLAVVYLVAFERRWWALAMLALPPLLYQPQQAFSHIQPDGTRVDLIHSQENYYGDMKVVDYSYGDTHYRELIIDGLVQGGIDLANNQSIYDYVYFMQFLPFMLAPEGKRCLVIGLGMGVIPRWFEQQGVSCDVVDINPAVVDIARSYFDFRISGDMVVQDARYFLNATDRRYDYIVLDVFSGDITPGHLLSVEALTLMRERLTPRGVLAVNLIGSIRRETYMTASVIKTLQQPFDQVETYLTYDPARSQSGVGNLAVVAYQGPARKLTPDHARFRTHPGSTRNVFTNLGRRFQFPAGTPAIVLSDDYNPIDFFDGWLRETVRRDIVKSTHWDLLSG